jgi:hypothetical protein
MFYPGICEFIHIDKLARCRYDMQRLGLRNGLVIDLLNSS